MQAAAPPYVELSIQRNEPYLLIPEWIAEPLYPLP